MNQTRAGRRAAALVTAAVMGAVAVAAASSAAAASDKADRIHVAANTKGGGNGKGGGKPTTGSGGGGTTTPPPTSYDLSTANVVLNAAQNRSDTGGNDLQVARALFRSASFPESNGGLESSWNLLNDIGQNYSRVINSEDTSVLDASGVFTPANRLLWNLQWVQRYNLNAHVIVGQRRPSYMPAPASSWDANQWAAYQEYAYRLIRYVAVEFQGAGFPEAMFEVGNEVDITTNVDDLWTLANPAVPQGAEDRYQHYIKIYRVWANAVARVASEYPSRSVKIAGPAMGGQSLFLSNTYWHERFVSDVSAQGLRLDVLTSHFYGDLLNGWANVPGSSLVAQLNRMRSALASYGRSGTPISITEYGPSEASDSYWGRINATHEGAAWAATFVSEALAGGANYGSYLVVRDNFGANTTGVPTVASINYIESGRDYPKAVHNAFQAWTMLPGTRKTVTLPAQQPNVRAAASADASAAGLLVYNYNYRFAYPTEYRDTTVNENVVPGFASLPFNGNVVVERYLIDAVTSNVSQQIDSRQPLNYNTATLQRVEQCYSTAISNTLVLPARTLGPSAVSLWLVKPYGGTVDTTQTCR